MNCSPLKYHFLCRHRIISSNLLCFGRLTWPKNGLHLWWLDRHQKFPQISLMSSQLGRNFRRSPLHHHQSKLFRHLNYWLWLQSIIITLRSFQQLKGKSFCINEHDSQRLQLCHTDQRQEPSICLLH